jgi:hypothetical protein
MGDFCYSDSIHALAIAGNIAKAGSYPYLSIRDSFTSSDVGENFD